jgi:xanthine dehydrogenase accessory factor
MSDSAEPVPETSAATFYEQVGALEREGAAFVLVVLAEALGSTPQDSGAKMIVTPAGRHAGNVGGGRVEAKAIAFAQDLLASGVTQPRLISWTLKTDVGMTCGGAVKFYFEPHSAAAAVWPIAIFGAGHVAQALLRVLQPLPCFITICDSRQEWLDRLPRARNFRVLHHDSPAELVSTLAENTFLLCLTKGHTTDRPILERALRERSFPYLGVIGSEAKAAVLRRELVASGLSAEAVSRFHCPVGLDFGTNHPHEIAVSIAAQLLTERDRLASAKS